MFIVRVSFKMYSVVSALFVLQLSLLSTVQSSILCPYSHIRCTTLGDQNVYNAFITGIEKAMESSDLLYMPEIAGETPSLEYQMTNLTLSGIRECQLKQLMINDEESTFQYDLLCPQLVFKSHFFCKGSFGPVEVDGGGMGTVTLNDYLIDVKGKYGYYYSHMDQKLHFYLKNFYSEFEPRGAVVFNVQGSLNSDSVKSELAKTYLNEHPRDFEPIMRSPTMKSFMAIFMQRVDTYLRTFPADEVIPAY